MTSESNGQSHRPVSMPGVQHVKGVRVSAVDGFHQLLIGSVVDRRCHRGNDQSLMTNGAGFS